MGATKTCEKCGSTLTVVGGGNQSRWSSDGFLKHDAERCLKARAENAETERDALRERLAVAVAAIEEHIDCNECGTRSLSEALARIKEPK